MCDPVIGTALAVGGVLAQGYAANRQARHQASVQRFNAEQQRQEAQQVLRRGVEEESAAREQAEQLLGRQRTQLAATGVDIDSGSAAQIQQQAAQLAEIDALRIRSNRRRQAQSIEQQAELGQQQARNTERGGRLSLLGSFLGAGGQVAGSPISQKWFS